MCKVVLQWGDLCYCFFVSLSSALLKSPTVSVTVGTSMNSPGLQLRNMSTTLLEPANTPITFAKHDPCKATPLSMPSSPCFNGPVGSTPHTSTPVAPCKSSLAHSCHEDCMPGSSLTPSISDSTVNYAITNGPSNQLQHQSSDQSTHAKDSNTGPSFITLSNLHDTFHYPGGPMPKKSRLLGENSVQAQSDLSRGMKQAETSSIVCIEESPPNSQGVKLNDISNANSEGKEVLMSSVAADQQSAAKSTNLECVSRTPDLRPVDSERAESPVLFDTPGGIGGPQSIAAKLSNIVNSRKQPTSGQSNSKADYDDDKTPPISPDDNATKDTELKYEQKETNEVDAQPSFAQPNVCANSSHNEVAAENESPDKRSARKRQHKCSSALGQPRTRRANTRMATRKSTAENRTSSSSKKNTVKTPANNETVEDDEDDFVPEKRTPRKQVTVIEPMDVQVG